MHINPAQSDLCNRKSKFCLITGCAVLKIRRDYLETIRETFDRNIDL